MYSNRSGHSRQRSERSSRQWDGYDDRWEERREHRRDALKEAHYEDGYSSTERTKRGRDYSDSPNRPYSKDSLNSDRSRKSPVRRRMSSPEWGASERKRRRCTGDDEDDYRYRRASTDKASRRSPDVFSRAHVTKDFKHTEPQEEDFNYRRKTSQDSRQRHRYEEFTYRQHYDDSIGRRSSGHHKERDDHERSRGRLQERTHSQDLPMKSYTKPRERNGCPSIDHEDHRQNRETFPPHTSSSQSFESGVSNQSAVVPEENKTSVGYQGFQRFLEVLNKGVNVTLLTKIVTQTPEQDDPPHSSTTFMNTADRPRSPICAARQQESHQSSSRWNEGRGSQRPASPQPCHRPLSPNRGFLSDEQSLQRGDGEQRYISFNRRSGSPPAVEKITLSPEDEHKHRQMQNVLQAIGMDLGFEELGQMSHRIQERLYGKKDVEGVGNHRRSREKDAWRASSPRQQSKSLSSSRSSFSPSPRDYYVQNDSCSAQRDETEARQVQVHPTIDYSQESSSSTSQESEPCDTNSQETTAACQAISQHPTYTLSEPSPAAVMSAYSPVNRSQLPYPALPPHLPPVGPRLVLPHLPPFLPYPGVPPLNIFPGVLAQTRHLLPQHISNPQPLFNLPVQPLNNTQKSKTLSRPRCLQVIETKQPG